MAPGQVPQIPFRQLAQTISHALRHVSCRDVPPGLLLAVGAISDEWFDSWWVISAPHNLRISQVS